MSATELAAGERRYRTATFGRILCGINGSRSDAEAVSQAALLSGSEGRLEIVCVVESRGYGASEQATIAAAHVETAMRHARDCAKELGVTAHTCVVHGPSPWESLAHMAAEADLVVLGSRGGSRAGGIVLGSVATQAVHRAELPILIARPASGASFPDRILLASDGSPGSRAAAELAATIARVHRSEVTLFTAEPDEPVPAAIVRRAVRDASSLVVVGSTGKAGVKALGSVSERVAHEAPCSVLVARGPHPKEQT